MHLIAAVAAGQPRQKRQRTTSVGIAFAHGDGRGYDLVIRDGISVSGRVQLRQAETKPANAPSLPVADPVASDVPGPMFATPEEEMLDLLQWTDKLLPELIAVIPAESSNLQERAWALQMLVGNFVVTQGKAHD